MIPWSVLAKWAWDALQPPDPNSPGEKIKQALQTYEEVGDACELANEVLKLSDKDSEGEESS